MVSTLAGVPSITISMKGKPNDLKEGKMETNGCFGRICKGCCSFGENNTRPSKDNKTDCRYWLHYREGEKQYQLFKSNSFLKEQDQKTQM